MAHTNENMHKLLVVVKQWMFDSELIAHATISPLLFRIINIHRIIFMLLMQHYPTKPFVFCLQIGSLNGIICSRQMKNKMCFRW